MFCIRNDTTFSKKMFLACLAEFCINWPFFILHTKKNKGRSALKTCGAI